MQHRCVHIRVHIRVCCVAVSVIKHLQMQCVGLWSSGVQFCTDISLLAQKQTAVSVFVLKICLCSLEPTTAEVCFGSGPLLDGKLTRECDNFNFILSLSALSYLFLHALLMHLKASKLCAISEGEGNRIYCSRRNSLYVIILLIS